MTVIFGLRFDQLLGCHVRHVRDVRDKNVFFIQLFLRVFFSHFDRCKVVVMYGKVVHTIKLRPYMCNICDVRDKYTPI